MSALNSLPLPVVRLLAFFHEELSERRPGRVPQTMQLWVGCLLVILISMTFEIPLWRYHWQCCFTVFSRTRFTPNLSRSCLWLPRCWRSAACFDLQMVIWRTVDPIDHLRADPDGLHVLMRTHRLGLVFSPSPLSLFTGKPSPPCSTIRKWSCA